MCAHALQECAWAAKCRRTSKALGPKCERCALVVQRAFALMSWDQVVAQSAANPAFASLVRDACNAQEGGSRNFTPEQFSEQNHVGYRVEQAYSLFTSADLEKMAPGTTFKDIASFIKIDSITDEKGVVQEGILLPDASSPLRVIAYRDWNTQYQQLVHSPSQQLRRNQGLDICEWYRKDLEKVTPSPLVPRKAPQSLSSIREAVGKAQAAKEAACAQATLMRPPEAETVEEKPAKPAEEEDTFDIVYSINTDEQRLTAPSEGKSNTKGAGRSKGAKNQKNKRGAGDAGSKGEGRGRGAAVRLRGKTAPSATSRLSTEGMSEAGTRASQGSGPKSPADKADKSFQTWMENLSLEKLLAGVPVALSFHHAKNALGGLKAQHGEAHVAYVLLKGHMDLFQAAQKLLPLNIGGTKASERATILRDLKLANVSIPVYTAASLLGRACQEECSLEKKLAMLTPLAATESAESLAEPFDPMAPTLAGAAEMGLADTEQGKIIQRGLITDTLIPLICAGEGSRSDVESLCSMIVSQWQPLLGKTTLMVGYAVEELVMIAQFLLVLLATTSTEDDAAKIAKVFEASKGSKVIVKQACLQSSEQHKNDLAETKQTELV